VVAEALEMEADYLISLDQQHLVGNPRTEGLPVTVGTPGDFLAWYRQQLTEGESVQPGDPGT
jgi:predicted nucleic acid-binding protein